ncbi:hypothetical protein N9O21_06075, partial [Rhodobacteraceae bacterium]|nr:hypothetical protein [Paracoccaceae bacterium]
IASVEWVSIVWAFRRDQHKPLMICKNLISSFCYAQTGFDPDDDFHEFLLLFPKNARKSPL